MKSISILAVLLAAGVTGSGPAALRSEVIRIDVADLQRAVDEAPPHSILISDRNRQVEVAATVRIKKPLTLVGRICVSNQALDTYMITGNLSSVADTIKGHRAVVSNNLPPAVD